MAAVKKSETFPGYKLITYDDGTYGYVMADGNSNVGYKSKDGAKKAAKKLAANAALITPHTLTNIEQSLADELSALYDDAAKYLVDKAKNFVSKHQTGKQYDTDALNALIKQCTSQIAKTNTDAVAAINGYAPVVAAEQANFAEYAIEDGTTLNPSFTLLNQDTVLRLIKDSPAVLPKAKAKIEKNKRWNAPKLRNALTRAIVQGDSIPKLSKKVEEICGSNKAIATRNARTMMTGARNAGTLAAYVRAEQNGMHIQKQWMAALDERTRASHRHLDGEIKPVTEKFSNGLMHPGDTSGSPAEVYNCRCTMVPIVNDMMYEGERASKLKDMSYEEWKAAQPKPKPKSKKPDAQQQTTTTTTAKVDDQQQQPQQSEMHTDESGWYIPAQVDADSINLSPEHMNWVSKKAYDNYSAVVKSIGTYDDLVAYVDKKLGIPVESVWYTNNPDKKHEPFDIDGLTRARQLVAMIEQYASSDALKNLKGIKFFDGNYVGVCNYITPSDAHKKADAGWLFIRPDDFGENSTMVKAFAHMYLYGSLPPGADKYDQADYINTFNPYKSSNGTPAVTTGIVKAFTSTDPDYRKFLERIASEFPQVEQPGLNNKPATKTTPKKPTPATDKQSAIVAKPHAVTKPQTVSSPPPKSTPVTQGTMDLVPVPTVITKGVEYDHEYDFKTWKTSDAYARAKTGEIWRGASTAEKNAAYSYTSDGYRRINARLNGYTDEHYTRFKGVGKTAIAKGTKELTDLISRSTFDDAIVVTRRDSATSLGNFVGIPKDKLDGVMYRGEKFDPADFVGKSNRFMSFISTSFSRDGDFGKYSPHTWVEYEIHCPPGAEMLYCEPFSAHGDGDGRKWDGYSTQKYAGEKEMLLQRGGSYTIVDIKQSSDKLTVVMELNLEDGYDKYGQ